MYPPPRASARATASAASSPRTNPLRSNNDRDDAPERRRSYDTAISLDRGAGEGGSGLDEMQNYDDKASEYIKKLNQIVQQFFVKGALTIVGSRVTLPQAFTRTGDLRQNRWFNLVLDDSDELANHTMEWKNTDLEEERPPPLVVEIFLDLSELTRSQSLVIVDEQGKRWDVAESLNPSVASSARPPSRMDRTTQVTLEQWEIRLDGSPTDSVMHPDKLSTVYKRGIPLFRALFTYGRTLPAFRYCRRIARQPANQPVLKLKYRISNGNFKSPRRDTLDVPLVPHDDRVTEHYSFDPLQCSAGTLNCSVSYRTKCEFRVDDSESLLSSHFMGLDDHYFKPSLAGRQEEANQVPSSVPTSKKEYVGERDQGQAYGSLSTFHRTGAAMGSSPLSAMRAVRDDDSASPGTTPPPHKIPPNHRTTQGSRSSLRSETGPSHLRRPSVSFQPFKAGSLASSPGVQVPPSPGSSVGKTTGINPLAQARNRNSLTTIPQHALRTTNIPNETAIVSSASSSPKPAPINRYSSSFSQRRGRFSSTGSKGDDDQNSSGKQSASSSAVQPGSDLLNEAQGGSSGSMPQTDDDNLKDFIRLLEQKKELKSFNRTDSASKDASMRRTTAALSKYRGMRDSNSALLDSMSSSLLLHRSSSSSSRQLSSVPPMVHGTSVSTSSSPGKPISPHTPHTPAIPSRLSDHLTIDYNEPRQSRSRRRAETEPTQEEDSSDTTTHNTGTTAINIPTSPRAWPYARRSNSVAQQHRVLDDYGIRSASVPAEERTELSMSELLRVVEGRGTAPPEDDRSPEPESSNLPAYPFPTSRPESREETSRPSSAIDPALTIRSRLSRGRRGSPSFSTERGTRYPAGSRTSAHANEEDDLIFHFSELNSASRRSLEEARGGGVGGVGPTERRRGGSPWRS